MKLNQLIINQDNPRQINQSKLKKLIDEILEFPKMLQIRKIIYDDKDRNKILGGNMRYLALLQIRKRGIENVKKYFSKKGIDEGNLEFFQSIFDGIMPDSFIAPASSLTEEEKKKFIILDNLEYGHWDYDLLGKGWDEKLLKKLGVEKERGYFQLQQNNIEKFNAFKMPYPITVVVTKEEYEEWQKLKKESGITNDFKFFKKVYGDKFKNKK